MSTWLVQFCGFGIELLVSNIFLEIKFKLILFFFNRRNNIIGGLWLWFSDEIVFLVRGRVHFSPKLGWRLGIEGLILIILNFNTIGSAFSARASQKRRLCVLTNLKSDPLKLPLQNLNCIYFYLWTEWKVMD